MEEHWKEIAEKKGNERNMEKKIGKKENKRKMTGNDSKMPFHLIFHYFMQPRRTRSFVEEMKRDEKKWHEMKRNGRECKELKEIKGDERKWKVMKRK